MTMAMWEALPGICDRIEGDPGIRVVVLGGAGSQAFSAAPTFRSSRRSMRRPRAAPSTTRSCGRRRPGCGSFGARRSRRCEARASAAGCGLALACDLRVAGRDVPLRDHARAPGHRLQSGRHLATDREGRRAAGQGPPPDGAGGGRGRRPWPSASPTDWRRTRRTARWRSPEHLAALAPGALAAIKRIANGLSQASPPPDLQAVFEATFAGAEFREGRDAFLERAATRLPRRGGPLTLPLLERAAAARGIGGRSGGRAARPARPIPHGARRSEPVFGPPGGGRSSSSSRERSSSRRIPTGTCWSPAIGFPSEQARLMIPIGAGHPGRPSARAARPCTCRTPRRGQERSSSTSRPRAWARRSTCPWYGKVVSSVRSSLRDGRADRSVPPTSRLCGPAGPIAAALWMAHAGDDWLARVYPPRRRLPRSPPKATSTGSARTPHARTSMRAVSPRRGSKLRRSRPVRAAAPRDRPAPRPELRRTCGKLPGR